MGFVLSGGVVGGVIVQPLFSWLIERAGTWRVGWISAALIVLLVTFLSLFIRSKPSDVGQQPDGFSEGGNGSAVRANRSKVYRTTSNWPLKAILRSRVLWLILVVEIGIRQSFVFITAHGVLHFTDIGFSSMEGALLLSVCVGSSIFSRIPTGWLADRVEPKWIITTALGLMCLSLTSIWLSRSLTLLFGLSAIFGFCFGGLWVMLPTIKGNYFGAETYHHLFGFTHPITSVFVYPSAAIAGFIADHTGSYDFAFLSVAAILALGFASSLFLRPPMRAKDCASSVGL
jgi:sugar phosphate permease